MTTRDSGPTPAQRDPWGRLRSILNGVGEGVGYVSAFVLLILVCSITLGIAMRTLSIDNTWTYDVDLFALIWLAFVGAAFTHVRGHHVTTGISLETVVPRYTTFLVILRFVIIVGFLAVFTVSGFSQFIDSVRTHETTIDVMSWPVWIATIALPVGTLLWLVAEVQTLLNGMTKGRD